MTKTDKVKIITAHDELLDSWQKAEKGNDEYSQGKAEAYCQAITKIRESFPSLFVSFK